MPPAPDAVPPGLHMSLQGLKIPDEQSARCMRIMPQCGAAPHRSDTPARRRQWRRHAGVRQAGWHHELVPRLLPALASSSHLSPAAGIGCQPSRQTHSADALGTPRPVHRALPTPGVRHRPVHRMPGRGAPPIGRRGCRCRGPAWWSAVVGQAGARASPAPLAPSVFALLEAKFDARSVGRGYRHGRGRASCAWRILWAHGCPPSGVLAPSSCAARLSAVQAPLRRSSPPRMCPPPSRCPRRNVVPHSPAPAGPGGLRIRRKVRMRRRPCPWCCLRGLHPPPPPPPPTVAPTCCRRAGAAIMGGQDAAKGEYPFVTRFVDSQGFGFCGGTLIHPMIVRGGRPACTCVVGWQALCTVPRPPPPPMPPCRCPLPRSGHDHSRLLRG